MLYSINISLTVYVLVLVLTIFNEGGLFDIEVNLP
mgnify:CR=1 FL=1